MAEHWITVKEGLPVPNILKKLFISKRREEKLSQNMLTVKAEMVNSSVYFLKACQMKHSADM